MTDKVSVVEALSAVMGDVHGISKKSRNEKQGFNFRGIDAVLNTVGPVLRTHGVIVLPRVLTSQYSTFTSKGGGLMHECILEVEFTFVGPDGSTLSCTAMGESADSGDKATPKAHSVAMRTALLQALCIPTDEPDPDSQTYERAEAQRPDPAPEVHPAAAELQTRLDVLPGPIRAKALDAANKASAVPVEQVADACGTEMWVEWWDALLTKAEKATADPPETYTAEQMEPM